MVRSIGGRSRMQRTRVRDYPKRGRLATPPQSPCLTESFDGALDLTWVEWHRARSRSLTVFGQETNLDSDGVSPDARVADITGNEFAIHRWDAGLLPAGHDYFQAVFYGLTDVTSVGDDVLVSMTLSGVPPVEHFSDSNVFSTLDWSLFARASEYPGGVAGHMYPTGFTCNVSQILDPSDDHPVVNLQVWIDLFDDFAQCFGDFEYTPTLWASGDVLGFSVTGPQHDPTVNVYKNGSLIRTWNLTNDGYDSPFFDTGTEPLGTMAGFEFSAATGVTVGNNFPTGWDGAMDNAMAVDNWQACPA